MIYIAIGLALLTLGTFIVSFVIKEGRLFARHLGFGGFGVTAICFGISSVTVVQPGHVGVPVLFGSVQEHILEEGFHFVNPFVEINEMSIQTQNITMSGDGALHVMSSDQLSMTLDVTVLYHLDPAQAPGVRRFMPQYQESVVASSVRTAVRDAVREYDAVTAVSSGRDELGQEMIDLVRERIANALEQRELVSTSIRVDDVQLRNISLPEEIRDSIAGVQRQRQLGNEREQAIRTAEQEAQRAMAEAEGQRRVAIVQAQRDAEARLIRARSEAEANNIITQSISPDLLRLRAIEATQAITSSDGTRTVVLGSGNSQTPLILNLGQ